MIKVTRLDDREIYVNADMIEFIEKTDRKSTRLNSSHYS